MSADVTQDLYDVFRRSIPPDVTASPIGEDVGITIATILTTVQSHVEYLARQSALSTATGTYLDLHARDRGLRRQENETDDQLRERLRTPPKAGTLSAIRDALTQIVPDGLVLIELPLQAWFFDERSAFFDRQSRFGGGRGVVIALIPATAGALGSITDALRSKISAGKIALVQEYS